MTALRNAAPTELLERQADEIDASTLPWSRAEMLAASQLDALQQLAYLYASAHSKQPVPRPKPTPRPGVAGQRKRRQLTAEQRARRAALDPRMRQKPPDQQ